MKKTIFLMAMLLTLSAAAPMASATQQSHRNRPHTQMVDKKDKDAADEEGVVAYSDTVTADTASAVNGGGHGEVASLPRKAETYRIPAAERIFLGLKCRWKIKDIVKIQSCYD